MKVWYVVLARDFWPTAFHRVRKYISNTHANILKISKKMLRMIKKSDKYMYYMDIELV